MDKHASKDSLNAFKRGKRQGVESVGVDEVWVRLQERPCPARVKIDSQVCQHKQYCYNWTLP